MVLAAMTQPHGPGRRTSTRLVYGCSYMFTCPAITVATVILRALDRVRERALDPDERYQTIYLQASSCLDVQGQIRVSPPRSQRLLVNYPLTKERLFYGSTKQRLGNHRPINGLRHAVCSRHIAEKAGGGCGPGRELLLIFHPTEPPE